MYSAATPKVTVSNPLGLPTTLGGEPGLFVATPAGQGLTAEEGQRLGSVAGLIAPAWPSADELELLSCRSARRSCSPDARVDAAIQPGCLTRGDRDRVRQVLAAIDAATLQMGAPGLTIEADRCGSTIKWVRRVGPPVSPVCSICRQICRRTAENRGVPRGNAAHATATFELARHTVDY